MDWWKKENHSDIARDVVIGVAVTTIAGIIASGFGLIPRPGFLERTRHSTASTRVMAAPPRKPPRPLTLTASYDLGVYSDGWILDIPDRGTAASAFGSGIHDCQSLWTAARRAGAVDVRMTHLRILAESESSRPVTIVGIRAEVLSRHRPLVGALVECPGGGEVQVIPMRIKLDDANPVALHVWEPRGSDQEKVGGSYFAKRAIVLHRGNLIPIRLSVLARADYVVWKLVVTAEVNGSLRSFVLDNHGRPWRTTAPQTLALGHPDYIWQWGIRPQPRLEIHHRFFRYEKWFTG